VIDPKGQRIKQIKEITLSEFGSYDGELVTSESAAVGWYQFVLNYTANNQTHQRYPIRVLVSDFTPSPFRVNTELNGDQFQAGDTVSVTTLAKMHAGGPYADADARVTARLSATLFSSNHPEAKGFHFNSNSRGRSQTIHQDNSAVDKSGELVSEFKLGEFNFHFGRISIESAVRDDRGKFVAASSSADYVGRDRFIGGLKTTTNQLRIHTERTRQLPCSSNGEGHSRPREHKSTFNLGYRQGRSVMDWRQQQPN